MGKIKKIQENELVGGTQSTDVYPVTSVKAVYDENNERLDHILNMRGVVNISTNYNADHTAEVLTLEQAIAKVPSKDRVLGFQGKFLTSEGWKSYIFIGDSISDWTNKTKWNKDLTNDDIVQGLGESEDKVMSQKAVSTKLSDLDICYKISESPKINKFIKEIYITPLFFKDKNWEKIYIYFIKRNVDGVWQIVLTDDINGTNNFSLKVNSELSYISNEYIHLLVDWSAETSGVTNYNSKKYGYILSSHATDLNYSPSIANILKIGNFDYGSSVKSEIDSLSQKVTENNFQYKVSDFYKINYIIKEIYLTEDFFTEKNWEKVYIFKVQRNKNNTWLIVLSEDASGTESFALTSKSEDALLFNKYAYVILDWDYIEEGTEVFLKNDGYILSSHSKNLGHASGIYSKINDEHIESIASTTKENTSSIKELVHQFGINAQSNLFIKECYLTDKFFTDYGWNIVYCFSIRRKFNGMWQIIFSNDNKGTQSFSLIFGSSGENYAENDYIKILVDWSQVKEGNSFFSETQIAIDASKCSDRSLITMIGSESNKAYSSRTGTELYNYAKSVSHQPMFTWIDDDGVYSGIEKIRTVFEKNSIPITFAVIPPLNDIAHDDVTRLEYFKSLQLEGYHITSHPVHKYWYGDNYDITKVESSLISCLTELQSSGFLHSDMLVYPGSSSSKTQVVEYVKKWCCCGIAAGFENANHLGLNTKWNIKRCFIEFSAEHTVTWYKQLIDDTYKKGDWLIFGTHSNGFNTSTDTSDESANNIGNLNEVIAYAKTKGTFYSAWDAYNRRKPLFDAVEYNQ